MANELIQNKDIVFLKEDSSKIHFCHLENGLDFDIRGGISLPFISTYARNSFDSLTVLEMWQVDHFLAASLLASHQIRNRLRPSDFIMKTIINEEIEEYLLGADLFFPSRGHIYYLTPDKRITQWKTYSTREIHFTGVCKSTSGNFYFTAENGLFYLSSMDIEESLNTYYDKPLILEECDSLEEVFSRLLPGILDTIWHVDREGISIVNRYENDTSLVFPINHNWTNFHIDSKHNIWLLQDSALVFGLRANLSFQSHTFPYTEGQQWRFIEGKNNDMYLLGSQPDRTTIHIVPIQNSGKIGHVRYFSIDGSYEDEFVSTDNTKIIETTLGLFVLSETPWFVRYDSVEHLNVKARNFEYYENNLFFMQYDSIFHFRANSKPSVLFLRDGVKDFVIDKNNSLWISTRAGLFQYFPQTNQFRNHNSSIVKNLEYQHDLISFCTGRDSLLIMSLEGDTVYQKKEANLDDYVVKDDGLIAVSGPYVYYYSFDSTSEYCLNPSSKLTGAYNMIYTSTQQNIDWIITWSPKDAPFDPPKSIELFKIETRNFKELSHLYYYLRPMSNVLLIEPLNYSKLRLKSKKTGDKNVIDQVLKMPDYSGHIADTSRSRNITLNIDLHQDDSFDGLFAYGFGKNFLSGHGIKIEYINAFSSSDIHYIYQLNSSSDTSYWSSLSTSKKIGFEDLAVGDYELQVKAIDSRGNYSRKPAIVRFRMHPWWHSWQAISIFSITILCIVVGLSLRRGRQEKNRRSQVIRQAEIAQARLEERETTKQRIARDLHDESGQDTVKMQRQLELLEARLSPNSEDTKKLLSTIQDKLKDIRDTIRIFSWSVEKGTPGLEDLANDLYKIGSECFEHTPIVFAFTPHLRDDNEYAFSQEERQNIVMLLREAMTNCLKHSKCNKTHLSIQISKNNVLIITFEDNGIGFAKNSTPTGSGLKNMYRRAKQINAEVQIISKYGIGTKIVLTKPVSNQDY
ncbi:MAG: ATP-binding protein [Cyanobacteria bacterium J06649_11]